MLKVIHMMNVKEIELIKVGDEITWRSAKGTFIKGKKIRVNPRIVFSKITNKIIYWAELELDYCGG